MIHDDRVYGRPLITYKATRIEIESSYSETGMFAYATDIQKIGYYAETEWIWINSAGGTSGSRGVSRVVARWHADGPLAVYDEVDGIWVVPALCKVNSIILYIESKGSSGSTVVDIEKSSDGGNAFVSMFDFADKPELVYNDTNHTAISATSAEQILLPGTLLRMNIDQIATGARNLSVTLNLTEYTSTTSTLLTIMGIA